MPAPPGEMRHEAAAVDGAGQIRGVAAREFDERRQHVDQRDSGGHTARREAARGRDDEGHAAGALEEAHLVPEPALAQHLAVVAEEHHHRVAEARRVERAREAAELGVAERDGAVIGVAGSPDLLVRHGLGVHGADVADTRRVGIERDVAERDPRRVDRLVFVEVPEGPGDGEGVVRVGQRGHYQEGPAVRRADVVVDRPLGREGDLLVEVHLVGADAEPRVGHRGHVVVPARPLGRPLPVRRPAVVGGIDVGGGAAPRSRGAGPARRSASSPTGSSGSRGAAGSGRRSGCRRGTRRRCRSRPCGRAARRS